MELNLFKCISRSIHYDDHYFEAIIIYKSPKSNNVRLTVSVVNYKHVCYIEVYNSSNFKWSMLFEYQEVSDYHVFDYDIDKHKKLTYFNSNEQLILKHLEKVYGNLI